MPSGGRDDTTIPCIVVGVWMGAWNARGSLPLELLLVAYGPDPLEGDVVKPPVSNWTKSVESGLDRPPG